MRFVKGSANSKSRFNQKPNSFKASEFTLGGLIAILCTHPIIRAITTIVVVININGRGGGRPSNSDEGRRQRRKWRRRRRWSARDGSYRPKRGVLGDMQIGFLVSKRLHFDHQRCLNPPWIRRRWTIHPFCVFPMLHAEFEASHLRWIVMEFGDGEGCNVWKLFCLLRNLWKSKEKLFGYWESNGCLVGRIYVVDYFWGKNV